MNSLPAANEHRLSVSVALCTYNGARYLPAQLESIAKQVRPPDELVVCDDGSKDATIGQVEAFAQTAPFPVRLVRNAQNLGSNRNFEQAIGLCGGEVIFLSDQDDLWHPDKIATTLARFEANPAMDAIFSDGDVIDAQSQPCGRTLWQSVGFDRASQRLAAREGFHRFLERRFCVTGAALAFRSRLRERILPFPTRSAFIFHDAWIAKVAAVTAGLEALPDRLISYREHATQQIGFRTKLSAGAKPPSPALPRRERLARAHQDAVAIYQELLARCGGNPARLEAYRETIEHQRYRAELPVSRLARLPRVARQILRGGYRGTVFYVLTRALADALL